MNGQRTHNPYDHLPEVPSFTVTSTDVADGQPMPQSMMSGLLDAGGSDTSPQLSWSGFPAETRSFAVTVFDPDAPLPSGYWHWAVHDIPASVTSLASGAGSADGAGLPPGAIQTAGDAGHAQFVGAAPPPGHGPHRYFIAVHALDVPTLGVPAGSSMTMMAWMLYLHTIGRALIVATAER
jgi:Raf kinase inhibitor-like YbhB/YbcL family protein